MNNIYRDFEDILKLKNSEGLIIDCVDSDDLSSILDFMLECGVITDKNCFETAIYFTHNDIKRVLLLFDDIKDKTKVLINKMAIWKLQYHPLLNGIWLSDFISNNSNDVEDWQYDEDQIPIVIL